MSTLQVRLSKLEAAAGVGLDPLERLCREVESKPDEELLQSLALVRAWIAGSPEPDTPAEIVRWTERMLGLIKASGQECQ